MNYIFLVVGFVLLTISADWLINGSSGLAKRLNISDLVIGLTIVAFGTSAPELVVNIVAATEGSSDIALTNILGSNIINTLIILGISATIFPVACKKSTFRIEIPLSALAGLAALLLGTNFFGYLHLNESNLGISRIDGIILLVIFTCFCTYTIYQGLHNRDNSSTENYTAIPIWKAILLIILGLTGLIIGGELIVNNAVTIAQSWGISESVIGVTVVALGTSLPELATSAMAALKKNTDLAIGNVIGSNIFNVFFVLGISSVINPLTSYPNLQVDAAMAAGSSLLLLLFILISRKRNINRIEGISMLTIYGIYLAWLLSTL
jgi:cation:H+ antiporter